MQPSRPWAIAALVAASPCNPVVAQDTLDPVVVTASRFPERALGTAVGTRVITAEDIARSAARTLPEIIGQLGGVHIRDASGSPNQQLDLRGFGITGDQNTLVLLDGVRVSAIDLSSPHLMSIPLESIERIEILAGGGGRGLRQRCDRRDDQHHHPRREDRARSTARSSPAAAP